MKTYHLKYNISNSGFSINCFHSVQNFATVAPSKTLWSAPTFTCRKLNTVLDTGASSKLTISSFGDEHSMIYISRHIKCN